MKKFIIMLIALLLILCSCSGPMENGKLEYENPAVDPEFSVSVDAPILIRTVEMVQYYKDEKGCRLVFSSSKLKDVDGFINPEFSEDVVSDVFFDGVKIGGKTITKEGIIEIASNEEIEKQRLTVLPEIENEKYGLVYNNNAYVSVGDEWNLGDIRIVYYYISKDTLVSVSSKYVN